VPRSHRGKPVKTRRFIPAERAHAIDSNFMSYLMLFNSLAGQLLLNRNFF
jgi:hypothetical protein